MNKKIYLLCASLMVAGFASANDFKKIEDSLKRNNQDIPKVESIQKTPIDGIYEVVINKNEIFYTDKTGEYVFLGQIINSKNNKQENLTEKRMNELTKIDFKSFNLENAIANKKGTGAKKIVTFEDPNCGFCKKLTPELEKLNNITIYTFIIPILGKSSLDVAEKIWCSKDRYVSWSNYMKKGAIPKLDEKTLQSCNKKALEENVVFAQKNGITGTPAIFFEDGKSIKGYTTSDKILDYLK